MTRPLGGLLYRLEYDLVTDGWEIWFDGPSPLSVATTDFNATLADGRLVVEMITRFERDTEARNVVERLLRSWALYVLLGRGSGGELEFRFSSARVSDRETSTWRPANTR